MQSANEIRAKFDEYYWRNIYPLMFQKEKIRKKYVTNFTILILMSLFIVPVMIGLVWNYCGANDFSAYVIGGIYTITVYVLRAPFTKYKKETKTDIMNMFMKFFDGFRYEPEVGLSYYDIQDSYIFPAFDELHTDDCFLGTYDGVGVRICEEKLISNHVWHMKTRHNVITFLGVVLELDMNKEFLYHTFVVKDKGMMNALNKPKGFQKVALEDVVFENSFEAYSQNQIEARYLLTTAFMERMLKLKELYGGTNIQFSFNNNKVLIAINTKKNMFEPCSLFKSNLREKQVYNVFEQFMTIFSVIDILKLNQKTGM